MPALSRAESVATVRGSGSGVRGSATNGPSISLASALTIYAVFDILAHRLIAGRQRSHKSR